eukprot:s7580_g1.t1
MDGVKAAGVHRLVELGLKDQAKDAEKVDPLPPLNSVLVPVLVSAASVLPGQSQVQECVRMDSQLWVRAPCAFVKITDKGRPYLQPGVTTIMLKFLPPKTTSEMLIQALDERLPGRFDFFFLPRSRQRRTRSIDAWSKFARLAFRP